MNFKFQTSIYNSRQFQLPLITLILILILSPGCKKIRLNEGEVSTNSNIDNKITSWSLLNEKITSFPSDFDGNKIQPKNDKLKNHYKTLTETSWYSYSNSSLGGNFIS